MPRSRVRRFEPLEPRLPVFDLLGLGVTAYLVASADELSSQESADDGSSNVSILGDQGSDRSPAIPQGLRAIDSSRGVETAAVRRASPGGGNAADESFVPEANSDLVFSQDSGLHTRRSGDRPIAADDSFRTASLLSGQAIRFNASTGLADALFTRLGQAVGGRDVQD